MGNLMYFWLSANDQKFDSWAFFRQGPKKLIKSELCATISCKKCGKFDELLALEHIQDLPLQVNSHDDFVPSSDGVIFVSDRFREIVVEFGQDTVELLEAPSLCGYSILVPKRLLPFDVTISGMQFLRPCPECNRYRETCLSPMLESMSIEAFSWFISHPDVRFEHVNSQEFWFIAKSQAVLRMKELRIKGVQYRPVEQLISAKKSSMPKKPGCS
jgi:hypothetical protein